MDPLEILPYIKISRSLFSSFLWKENRSFTRFEAWLDLIKEACFIDQDKQLVNGKLIILNRGQLIASVRYLVKRWKWSNSKVCDFLELLRSQDMISIDSGKGISIITLINYEKHSGRLLEKTQAKHKKAEHLNGHKSHSYDNEGDSDNAPEGTHEEQPPDSEATKLRNSNKLKEGKKGNGISASLEAAYALTQQLKNEYEKLVNDIKDQKPADCWIHIKQFVTDKRPTFIEPYMDLWNIFAINYKLIKKPASITPNRKKKLETRIDEPSFDFIKILDCIKKSRFLKGENDRGWKVDFEFIVHSEENYTKILDEKYD